MIADAFRHSCFFTSLFILALKPETLRTSDAWSGRFFRCLRPREARPSLEKTAQGVADGLGEGFWLAFLFASFSLASKEKEEEYCIHFPHMMETVSLAHISPQSGYPLNPSFRDW